MIEQKNYGSGNMVNGIYCCLRKVQEDTDVLLDDE